MLAAFESVPQGKVHLTSGFNAKDGLDIKDYVEALESSKFALCPAGQDSMDSFRLYEALEAGTVPVTLTNSNQFKVYPSYWHGVFRGVQEMPFVMHETWEQCLEEVKNMADEEYERKRTACQMLWNEYKNIWKVKLTGTSKSYLNG